MKNPEMALVRFVVYDHDVGKDDFIAQFSLPFTSMKQGKIISSTDFQHEIHRKSA